MTPFLLIFKDYFKCDIKKFGLRKWRSSDGWDFFPKYKTILIFFFLIFKIFDRFLDKKKCQKILIFWIFFLFHFFIQILIENQISWNLNYIFLSENHQNPINFMILTHKIITFDQILKKIRLRRAPSPGGSSSREQPPAADCVGATMHSKSIYFQNHWI